MTTPVPLSLTNAQRTRARVERAVLSIFRTTQHNDYALSFIVRGARSTCAAQKRGKTRRSFKQHTRRALLFAQTQPLRPVGVEFRVAGVRPPSGAHAYQLIGAGDPASSTASSSTVLHSASHSVPDPYRVRHEVRLRPCNGKIGHAVFHSSQSLAWMHGGKAYDACPGPSGVNHPWSIGSAGRYTTRSFALEPVRLLASRGMASATTRSCRHWASACEGAVE